MKYLPETCQDATGLDRKKSIPQFAFALDSALTGDTAAADKAWARALELAPSADCRACFANKIKATVAFAPPPEDNAGREWLVAKLVSLQVPAEQ